MNMLSDCDNITFTAASRYQYITWIQHTGLYIYVETINVLIKKRNLKD